MTISYSAEVSLKKRLGNFLRLLRRWKASIYKLLYKEMLLYWLAYFTLNLFYRFVFTDSEKRAYMSVCVWFKQYIDFVPLTFILGFYVNMVVIRWWQIYSSLAWPDSVAMRVVAYIPGLDNISRLTRRSLMRWLHLSSILTLQSVSASAKKRYPTTETMVQSGLMTTSELEALEKLTYPSHNYWVPIKWAIDLLARTRRDSYMTNDRFFIELVNEVNNFRKKLNMLLEYDWITVPLVYTQVVTLAVYSFFFSLLFSRQYMGPDASDMTEELTIMADMGLDVDTRVEDPVSPVLYTTVQFLFYMGWLKVAESIINPLGTDEDDFEINWIMDRNLKYSFLIVDGMMGQLPALKKDQFWDDKHFEIPHTAASKGIMNTAPVASQHRVKLSDAEMRVVPSLRTPETDLNSGSSIRRGGPLLLTEKFAAKLGLLANSVDKKEAPISSLRSAERKSEKNPGAPTNPFIKSPKHHQQPILVQGDDSSDTKTTTLRKEDTMLAK